MPMHLQLFAEPGNGAEPASGQQGQQSTDQQDPKGNEPSEPGEGKDQSAGKTFSRDDVAKMIAAETNKARTAWEKELEAKQEEAKKLAKMNAEEKLQHQLEQKEAEIADLKRSQSLTEMSKEASKMLTEANLPHDEDLLGLIVTDDAEATKKAVAVITNFVSKIKKESARQEVPKAGGQFTADEAFQSTVAEMAKKNRIVK